MKTKVVLKDGVCWVWKLKFPTPDRRWPHACVFCNEELQKNDECFMFVNNYKLFPNVYAHTKCANTKFVSLKSCVNFLANAYEVRVDFDEEYSKNTPCHWPQIA